MKKFILLALATLLMAGCDERPVEIQDGERIAVIDSCEYIANTTYYGYIAYAHKGNCKYCAQRHKQELRELVEQLKKLREE